MRWHELVERSRRWLAYAVAGEQLMALQKQIGMLQGAITQVQDRNDELQQQIDNITEDINGLPTILTEREIEDLIESQVETELANWNPAQWAEVLPEPNVSDAVDEYFGSDEGILMLGDLLEESPEIQKKLDAIIAKRTSITTTT